MGAAILTAALDAAINKRDALTMMRRADWSVLMMFFGIFVWLDGLNKTKIPEWVWCKLDLDGEIDSAKDIAILTAFVIVGSNVFSNVPLTILVLAQLIPHVSQLNTVLYTAWVATISGNLTLFGSVANLIVAQKANQTLNYEFTFWKHLKFGLPSTLIITLLGLLILVGLVNIF